MPACAAKHNTNTHQTPLALYQACPHLFNALQLWLQAQADACLRSSSDQVCQLAHSLAAHVVKLGDCVVHARDLNLHHTSSMCNEFGDVQGVVACSSGSKLSWVSV
jgi:hypothetical protein